VQGAVSLRTSGQALRVDLRGSGGSGGSGGSTTGLRGTFEARFAIDELERPKEEGIRKKLSGTRGKQTSSTPPS
jgi:hypothetical protein